MLSIIEFDRKHDLAYILIRAELRDKPGAVKQSKRVAEDIVLDLDADGQLIGIELLNASSRLDLSKISEGPTELIVGVKEAAAMLGVEKSNFIRDYVNNAEFPAPVAELASGRFWLRSDINRYTRDKKTASRPEFTSKIR